MTDAPNSPVDPFDVEVITEILRSVVDEMFLTTRRSSHSPIINEVLDFAVGLTDPQGLVVTQGNGITVFLSTLGDAVRAVLDTFDIGEIRPGDLFVTNDPYEGGGTHLSDVSVIAPVHHRSQLVGFACNKAHWADVGGKEPGSVSTDATDIFQEGLRLPLMRLGEHWEPSTAIIELVTSNVRTPGPSLGDLRAQLASLKVANDRISAACERYGPELFAHTQRQILTHGEAFARGQVTDIPDGVYRAADSVEPDAQGKHAAPINCEVTVAGDLMICDFRGSSPQLPRPINMSYQALVSSCRVVFQAALGRAAPVNDGVYRRLRVIADPDSVVACSHPSPTSLYYEAMASAVDVMQRALAPVLPTRLAAGNYLSACAETISGIHPDTGDLFIFYEPNAGGWGASAGQDGARALIDVTDGDTYSVPVEVIERKHGIVVDRYSFNTTATGAGEWRGGEGIVREFIVTGTEATLTAAFGRSQAPPWGSDGGQDGSVNECTVIRAATGDVLTSGTFSMLHLDVGDRVHLATGTGGGWGNPQQRDPEAVAADVRNGFISLETAKSTYGVVLLGGSTSEPE